jgi:hypothetical protein
LPDRSFAWVVQSPDDQFATLSVDQSEAPPGGQSFGNVGGDCLTRPGLADCGRLGSVVAGDRSINAAGSSHMLHESA